VNGIVQLAALEFASMRDKSKNLRQHNTGMISITSSLYLLILHEIKPDSVKCLSSHDHTTSY
jgi:hypothetical protein